MVIEKICRDLNISQAVFNRISTTAPYRYKQYEIPKKNGGKRKIAQPAKEVKLLQRAAIKILSDMLPVHARATAYQKGCSIKKNAEMHKNNSFLIKTDFVDFFNSIFDFKFREFLIENNFDEYTASILSKLFFWKKDGDSNKVLSVGAPSSPWISNAIMHEFDEYLSVFCSKNNVIYTRYADDITLSATRVDKLLICYEKLLFHIIEYKKTYLTINKSKTVFLSPKKKRIVTGLVLSNDNRVTLGREKKRILRAMVHRYIAGTLDTNQIPVLIGWLAFLKDIEPGYWTEHYSDISFNH